MEGFGKDKVFGGFSKNKSIYIKKPSNPSTTFHNKSELSRWNSLSKRLLHRTNTGVNKEPGIYKNGILCQHYEHNTPYFTLLSTRSSTLLICPMWGLTLRPPHLWINCTKTSCRAR